MTALLGPNGAGKTTTVKVLTTLTRPTAGSARIDGIDVLAQPERIRPIIGVSGQYAAVDENLTGFENLDMVGRLYHLGAVQSRIRAQELITLFDLEEAKNRPVKGFSGGMRRRIDLAGALVTRPKVLFLDEPTTGLDPRSRLGMWDIITTLVGQGTTVLLTTRYLEEADQLADSISVIDDGRVIAQGTSDELKASIGGQRVGCAGGTPGDPRRTRRPQHSLVRCRNSTPDPRRCLPAPYRSLRDCGDCGCGTHAEEACREEGEEPIMTTADRTTPARAAVSAPGTVLAHWFSDGWITTRRNLIKIKRVPDILVFTTLQPIMFVLLFTYVYAGVINIPGSSYREFITAGIFAQTIVFGSTYSGSAMTQDLKDGIIDRFRTLPMSPSAVLIGRTNGNLFINAVSLVVMMITGFIVGWRIRSSFPEALGAIALLLLFAYAFSWVMAFIGMSVRSPEVINNVSFLILFPLTFISNAFVPSDTLPTPLRVFAEFNPVSALVSAVRNLFGNSPPNSPVADNWAQQNPEITVMIGIIVLLVMFVPLAIRKFARVSSR